MDIMTALRILEDHPPEASMWKVENHDYDLPEAILTLKSDCEANLDLQDEFDDLQKSLEKITGDVEGIKDDYRETFKTMVLGLEALIDDENKEMYDDISDFISDFKKVADELETALYQAI